MYTYTKKLYAHDTLPFPITHELANVGSKVKDQRISAAEKVGS
jgi:hypothetical protein